MITRIWRGWTSQHNAQDYQDLLTNEIFPGIAARQIPGYRGVSLLRRNVDNEVEFSTIMWFDSIEAVKAFAGPHYETAVVPIKARALLARFDTTSAHFDTVVEPPQWKTE